MEYSSNLKADLNYKLQESVTTIFAITLFSFAIINSLSGIPSIQAQLDAGNSSNIAVFPPDSIPYGLTYGEWTAKWWQWAYSMPEES